MRKLIWKRLTVSIAVILTFSTLSLFLSVKGLANERSREISQGNQKSTSEKLVDIFQSWPRRLNCGGSRAGCRVSDCEAIWPGNNQALFITWSLQPLFIWSGSKTRIEIHSPSDETALWTYDIRNNETSVFYNGPALQPGQSYQLFYNDERGDWYQAGRVVFKVMEAQERSLIEIELANLRNLSQTTNSEEAALLRANYFAEQELWGDVIREVLSVSNPSSAWVSTVEEIRAELSRNCY